MEMAALSELSPNINSLPPPSLEGVKMDSQPAKGESPHAEFFHHGVSKSQTTPLAMLSTSSRQGSPTPSTLSSLSSCSTPKAIDPLGMSGPPPKRRKYTAEEKEQQRLEKEERSRQRAEAKAKRDEEKLVKDRERQQKSEALEEKKRERELEKQKKEEEKRKKDEEKQKREDEKRKKEEERLKKENAQKRINSFFVKPTTPSKPTAWHFQSPNQGLDNETSQDPDTLESGDHLAKPYPPATSIAIPEASAPSDYSTYFLPFSLPSNSVWAPHNRYSWDLRYVEHFERIIATAFRNDPPSSPVHTSMTSILDLPAPPTRGLIQPSVKEVMMHLQGSSTHPIYIMNAPPLCSNPLELLGQISLKRIQFYEDVRPAYIGTYTKIRNKEVASRLGRNPFKKVRPDTDYEYDSEAEWEEPEEGEDLDSEGESEVESNDGAEEMDEFLDDDDATELQRSKRPIRDLEPLSSGLCWTDMKGKHIFKPEGSFSETSNYKLETIERHHRLPIDPFSICYWNDSSPVAVAKTSDMASSKTVGLGQKIAPPWSALIRSNNANAAASNAPRGRPPKLSNNGTKPRKPIGKLLEGNELEDFKKEVEGSDMTKLGIIEVLKKRFPKVSKDTLKDTLNSVAARVGAKDADKRWVIIDGEPPAAHNPASIQTL